MDEKNGNLDKNIEHTESQKSVATSNVYSLDFTDSGSERNNSSGKNTYVIEFADSDDSEKYQVHNNKSVVSLRENLGCHAVARRDAHSDTSDNKYSVVAEETFTQTSKTILELAQTEGAFVKISENCNLETQTSYVSVTENKTVEYRVELNQTNLSDVHKDIFTSKLYDFTYNQVLTNTLEDVSSKFPASETDFAKSDFNKSEYSSVEEIIELIDEESKNNILSPEKQVESLDEQYENTSVFEISSQYDTDIEDDSLMAQQPPKVKHDSTSDVSEVPNSVDNELAELYDKISDSIDIYPYERSQHVLRKYGTLTPLTEESLKNHLVDLTPDMKIGDQNDNSEDVLFTNNSGVRVKMFPSDNMKNDPLKLPPIQNNFSCPSSPQLNLLLSFNSLHKPLVKSDTLPCVFDAHNQHLDRWEISNKDLASGESAMITGKHDAMQINALLPPIHVIGTSNQPRTESFISSNAVRTETKSIDSTKESISINERIKDLKITNKSCRISAKPKYRVLNTECSRSRSGSPRSDCSPCEGRLCDVAERGCDVLCVELLRRLKSPNWFEIPETLQELPDALEKFWGVITENRIADLLRQVTALVESPRTQVAKTACNTLAVILKNTNYTKKPDFYESMTVLLTKTSSFSRPVRRAANVALDDIVCCVDYTNALTALCVHGVGHKSPLVRCASARLLVVCTALAGGGRGLLRARPPTAAAARRHALGSLAALLQDKDTDARKYAERLYAMLRPLPNFEAYYLNDVDIEIATKQMKKYDKLLLCTNNTRLQ